LRSGARIRIQRRRGPRAIHNPLADSFPFLRRHRLTAIAHSPSRIEATRATYTHTKISEKNPAESEQSESLPEGNLPPSEQRRQIPVPQMHHHFATNGDENHHPQNRHWPHPNHSLSHVVFPHLLINSS